MKKSKKKFMAIIFLIVLLGSIIIPKSSLAVGNTVELYATHRYGNLLVRNGVDLTCIYIVYQKDGIEYPSYCLNLELDGATEDFSYSVNVDNLITDMEIWRTVINGYPYKTPEELGCKTKEEAYLATRQAVYCAVYGRDPNSYGALGGEAGQRTLKALKQIVNAARTSTETKQSANLNIYASTSKWKIDKIDSNYLSKEYTVSAAAPIKNYEINLSGNIVEGCKVVDTNNKEKSTFANNEKFKIIIPIKNMESNGQFTINASAQVATKPVYYGKSGSSTLQNTAITGSIYEDGTGSKTEYYEKNGSKIIILKQNQKTKETLQGVKFQILGEDKKILFSDLTTDANGILKVENLVPGKYYIKETETVEGYEVYDKLIEVEVHLNEEVKVTVNNLHNEDIPKIETTSTEIEVGQGKSEINVSTSKVTVNNKNKNISLEQNITNVNNEQNNIEIKQENSNININKNNINSKQDNTNINTNQNNIKTQTNNENININQNNIETKETNKNININQNNTNEKQNNTNINVNQNNKIKLPKTGM